MTADIVKTITGMQPAGIPILTMLGAGVAKPILEGVLNKYIGNGNLLSGAVKLGAGLAIPAIAGKNTLSEIGALALSIDGAEDLVLATVGKYMPLLTGGAVSQVNDPFANAI